MALADEIQLDIARGLIPREFYTADLQTRPAGPGRYRVGDGEYAANALNTIPRNLSIRPDGSKPGNYVQNGQRPRFYWVDRGLDSLTTTRLSTCIVRPPWPDSTAMKAKTTAKVKPCSPVMPPN